MSALILDSGRPYFMSEGGKLTMLPTQAMALGAPAPAGRTMLVQPHVVFGPRSDGESGGKRGGMLVLTSGKTALLGLVVCEESARDLSAWFARLAEAMKPLEPGAERQVRRGASR